MLTVVLNEESAHWSVEHLLQQASGGGVRVEDADGNVVAFVLSPDNQEALTYLEANLDLNQNLQAVRDALGRTGGTTTSELLARAERAVRESDHE